MDAISLRTILVPTDFSACSLRAMRYALALAEGFSARVIALHVMERPAYGFDVSPLGIQDNPDTTLLVAELMEDWIRRVTRHGIEVGWHIEIGVPVEEIRSAVERHHVDLVVMGTHGRTGLAHAWLGSVAERVVQRSPCPVLTLKASLPLPEPGVMTPRESASPRPTVCHLCGKASN
ncbi:MAG: universal stress protein, partial [Nitrospiria bacterium]